MTFHYEKGGSHASMITGRPPATGTRGAVTSPHYLATIAGYDILRRGGHAVDAAIAMNLTLCVVYPHMAGLGGDLFSLLWDNKKKEIRALNGSGSASKLATREFYNERGHKKIPSRGVLSAITVPGAVNSWKTMHDEYGKLPWESLFESAIYYAEQGFPVSLKLSRFIERFQDELSEHKEAARIFLPDDKPLAPGEILKQTDLGHSLRLLSKQGASVFYKGELADAICDGVKKARGMLCKDDFSSHQAQWEESISTMYRGYEVHQTQPNTQGMAALMMLNYLEEYDMNEIGDQTPEYYHLMAEVAKLAFTFRDRYVTDPRTIDIPLEDLLSKQHVKETSEQISKETAADKEDHWDLVMNRDTVYMAVVDSEGNGVSLIESIFHEFGSMFIPEGTGILLQNRGSFFSLDEDHPNSLEPEKHTFHTIIPAMALKDGDLFMLYGSMGGEGQPQTQASLVTRVIDYGYDIQQAIEAPRWLYGRTWGENTESFKLESRATSAVFEVLKTKGHDVQLAPEWAEEMGHAQGIVINKNKGSLSAGADPRGDGIALSW